MPDRAKIFPLMVSLATVAAGPAASEQTHSPAPGARPTPLVLQPDDGELRLRRPPPAALANLAAPFLIKVDPTPQNGGSEDFYVLTEDIPVGASISPHRHPHSEEILYIHKGRGTAWLNGRESKLQPGTIIYMPRHTGVRLVNDGTEPISLVAIFSRPGFDKYHREVSVPAGETPKPLTREEMNAIRAKHGESVIYEQK